MKDKHETNDYLDKHFRYLLVSLRRRNILFVGEMLEEQVAMPTWMIDNLVDQLTKSVDRLN